MLSMRIRPRDLSLAQQAVIAMSLKKRMGAPMRKGEIEGMIVMATLAAHPFQYRSQSPRQCRSLDKVTFLAVKLLTMRDTKTNRRSPQSSPFHCQLM